MNNSNNQSGNSRTTFNALKGMPSGPVPPALKNIGKNPMASAAVMGAARNAMSGGETTVDENGEEIEQKPSALDNAKAGAKAAMQVGKEQAKVAAKKATKEAIKKAILAHPGILIGIGIFFLSVIIILILIVVCSEYADELAKGAVSFSERTTNLFSGDGFKTNLGVINESIEDAAKDFPGIDKGILYAIVEDGALISADAGEEVEAGERLSFNASDAFYVDAYNTHSFYDVKKELLGTISDPGKIIYSLVGEKIEVTCVDKEDYDLKGNVKALSKYAYNGMLMAGKVQVGAAKDVVFSSVTGIAGSTFNNIKIIDDVMSFANIGSSYSETNYNQLHNLLDNLPHDAIKKDWDQVKDDIAACEAKITETTVKPMKDNLTNVMENDYQQLYNYIESFYVTVFYLSILDSYTEERKEQFVKEVWDDIVISRNDRYDSNGIGNMLTYQFDSDGKLIASASLSYSGFAIGSVPTSEAAQAALTWRQNAVPWAGDYIGSRTIGEVGCFATSVAKLIAISGTTILSDTFDPGLFVKVTKAHNGFSGNDFNGYGWETIAPYFRRVDWVGLDNRSMTSYAGTLSAYIKSSMASAGYAGLGYYYVFLINYTKPTGGAGTHFIAIVGENENGELMVSDPANGKVYSIEQLNANTGGYYRNAKLGGISVYYASDVASGSVGSTGGA